jgi:hypothetical protein
MGWVWAFIISAGVLFAIKMVYVFSTAVVLPATQGALYVSTSGARIRSFLEAVPMSSDQLLIDLGCGDGRVLRYARKLYGVRTIGYEINPMAYLRARLHCLAKNGIQIRYGNFWHADVGHADVIFCYLFPDVMARMAHKIEQEAKPGATVVSCNFPLPGQAAQQILRPSGSLHHDPIYIYRIGHTPGAK